MNSEVSVPRVLTAEESIEQNDLLERGSASQLLRFAERHKWCDLQRVGVAIAERGALFQIDALLAAHKGIPEAARTAIEARRFVLLEERAHAFDAAKEFLVSLEHGDPSLGVEERLQPFAQALDRLSAVEGPIASTPKPRSEEALRAFSEARNHLFTVEAAIAASPNPMITVYLAQRIAAARDVFKFWEKPTPLPLAAPIAFPADPRSIEQGDDALLRVAERLCHALSILYDRVFAENNHLDRAIVSQMTEAINLSVCEERLLASDYETHGHHREMREALDLFDDLCDSPAVRERLDEYKIEGRESGAYAEEEMELAVRDAEVQAQSVSLE